MNNRKIIAATLSIALCAGLAGCGSGSFSGAAKVAESVMSYDSAAMDSGSANSSLIPQQTDSRKIIYNATLSMESTAFDDARDAVLAAVSSYDAYIEYSDISGSAEDGDRYISYTVRVPADNYSDFLAAVGEAGSVQNLSESASDITANYIDVQARITALEAQRDRLNELADSAETTADLLEIESQLSDVQYQLESYTQQLRAMDDQISYSTVDIYLNEVRVLTPTGTTFGDRALAALRGGWDAFVGFIQWAVLALIFLLPLLVIVGIVVIILIATRPARAANAKKRAEQRAARQRAKAAAAYSSIPGSAPNAAPCSQSTHGAPQQPDSSQTPPQNPTPKY